MSRIFISYRRADSQVIAGRIYDRLETAFGKDALFMDIDDIPPGQDFRTVIDHALQRTRVMLVIIGPGWLDARDGAGNRRLDAENDWVRVEVERALNSPDIILIPVLVLGATPPPANLLPPSISNLAFRNGIEIHSSQHFSRDIQRLIETLQHTGVGSTGTIMGPAEDSGAKMYFDRGLTHVEHGNLGFAIADFTEAIRLKPDHIEALSRRGMIYGDTGDYEASAKDFSEIIRHQPDDPVAYNHRGIVYQRAQNHEAAMRDFNQSINLKSDYAPAYYSRGITYQQIQHDEAAIREFSEAIRIDPNFALAYNARADSLTRMQIYDAALRDYEVALRLEPALVNAYAGRAGIYIVAGNNNEAAIREYTMAIQVQPDNPLWYTRRGTSFAIIQMHEQALIDLNQALRLQPRSIEALTMRGMVLESVGNPAAAIQDFKLVQQLDPSNQDASEALKRLTRRPRR